MAIKKKLNVAARKPPQAELAAFVEEGRGPKTAKEKDEGKEAMHRTTLDLPAQLVKRAKQHALDCDSDLRTVVADALKAYLG